MNARTASRKTAADDYLKLVIELPLRPIRTANEYDAAAATLDRLVLRTDLSVGETDYLEALTRFVEDYDQRHFDFSHDRRSPLRRLQSLMKASDMTPADLGDLIGSRPAASMILKGTRELSKAQIRIVSKWFSVNPGIFL